MAEAGAGAGAWAGRAGEPRAARILSFRSSRALLLGVGEVERGVPLEGGGGRGGAGAEELPSVPNKSAVPPNRSPVGTWPGAPKSAINGFGAPGAACTTNNFINTFHLFVLVTCLSELVL